MYTVKKIHDFVNCGTQRHFLSGFAVIDDKGKVVRDDRGYFEVYPRKYAAQGEADHLNKVFTK